MSLAKVLVVDDNETVLEMSKFVLRAAADDAGTASGAAQDLVIIAVTACASEGADWVCVMLVSTATSASRSM